MADDYATLPQLSNGFIESNTPIARNLAVDPDDFDPIIANIKARGTIARTLPMYSVPGLRRL